MHVPTATFLVLEGLLGEAGEFHLERGIEVRVAPAELRLGGGNDRGVIIALRDGEGQTLAAVAPPVRFPIGCTTAATAPAWGLVRAALALSPEARSVEVRVHDRVVYQGAVAPEPPRLSDVRISATATEARIAFVLHETQAEVRVAALLPDGRRVRPPAQRGGDTVTIALDALEGLGQATFEVEATFGFRTATAVTDVVALPPPSPRGWIIEPPSGSQWPSGWRGSLIGTLCDTSGRLIAWEQQPVFWMLDGQRLASRRQITPWQLDEPGDHVIRLVRDTGDGQFDVLDEITIGILPPTAEQKEYADLIATRALR
jgi:hypothetical protein